MLSKIMEREVEQSRYAKDLKEIAGKSKGIHEGTGVKSTKNGAEILERFRMGSETRENEYWKKDEDRRCRACKKEEE